MAPKLELLGRFQARLSSVDFNGILKIIISPMTYRAETDCHKKNGTMPSRQAGIGMP